MSYQPHQSEDLALKPVASAEPCPKCRDSGWRPHFDADGRRVWLPLMNDALPCECGALARRYQRELPSEVPHEQP